MHRAAHSTSSPLWVIFLTLFLVRTSDAHMHLCFDGQEAPRTFHVADGPLHHDSGHDERGHNDVDVDAIPAAVAKSLSSAQDVLPPPPALRLVAIIELVEPQVVSDHPLADTPPPSILYLLAPPLRGPPR